MIANVRFFTTGLPQLPVNTDPKIEPDLRDIFNSIRTLSYLIGQYGGFEAAEPSYQNPQNAAYTAGVAKRRVYCQLTEASNYGEALHLSNTAGVLTARLANATGLTLACYGINNTIGASAIGDTVEVALPGCYVTSISGLTPGTIYYLSTVNGLITNVAPAGAGNLQQVVGVALTSDLLFFWPSAGIEAGAAAAAAAAAVAAHEAALDPHPQYALDTDLANYVPITRTVNGKALNVNITLNSADVGAVASASLAANVQTWLTTPSSVNLQAAMTDETGTGSLVFANTPTLITPLLGTPTSGTLTNCTGLPISTGVSGLGANVATWLATPSSANLRAALTDESGTGALVFAGGNIGAATGTSLAVTGALTSSGASAGVGYTTGSGGTVTQITNKATNVTLNTVTGQVTTHNAALAANAEVQFAILNSTVTAAVDLVEINHVSGGTFGAYSIQARTGIGGIGVSIRNVSAGSLSEALVLGFALVKSATS